MVAPTATMMVAPTATMVVAPTPMAAAVISSGKLLSTARAIASYDACESAIEVKLATYKKNGLGDGAIFIPRKKRTCPSPPSPKRLANRIDMSA
jgi:hypothetical protein